MQHRQLGNTGMLVSPIGLGTVKFGRNTGVKYPENFQLPTDDAIRNLLSYAQELGVNVLDTAPAYGNSEERLGALLPQRQQWVIVTKVGEEFIDGQSQFDFSPRHLRFSIERSLKRLRTDYLDVVLVHSDGNDEYLIQQQDVFATLQHCKQQGLIRAYGMSSKTVAGGLLTLVHSDVAMVTYNPQCTDDYPVIQQAYQQHKGVFIKKSLCSGHLQNLNSPNPVQTSLTFILQQPGVSSIIIGTLNPQHLQESIRVARTFTNN